MVHIFKKKRRRPWWEFFSLSLWQGERWDSRGEKYFVGLRNINSINNIWYMHYYYTHFIGEKTMCQRGEALRCTLKSIWDLGRCLILSEQDWSPSPFQTQDSYQKIPRLFAEGPASLHFQVTHLRQSKWIKVVELSWSVIRSCCSTVLFGFGTGSETK